MDYINPTQLVEDVIEAGKKKVNLAVSKILLKGVLSGVFLGYATTLAYIAATQTGLDIVGALVFPVGFVLVILLNLELVTSSFAILPMAKMHGATQFMPLIRNLFWAFTGNLLGSLFYGVLFYIYVTRFGHVDVMDSALAQKIIAVAEGKTLTYKKLGGDGFLVMFVKALLCNWMVTMGAIMGFSSSSTLGKIVALWIPVFIFFGHGFEHSVVNMFVIPTGMMLGADISMTDWWAWNQIPVTIGNFVAGICCTAFPLYYVNKRK